MTARVDTDHLHHVTVEDDHRKTQNQTDAAKVLFLLDSFIWILILRLKENKSEAGSGWSRLVSICGCELCPWSFCLLSFNSHAGFGLLAAPRRSGCC